MFRKYGFIGIVMILFAEINFFLDIEPFASRYFIIVWLGYILTIDAVVYKLRKRSLLMNNRAIFFSFFALSAIFWWIFELINLKAGNWNYNGVEGIAALGNTLWKTVYFSTVLPAFFETYELVRSIHLFDRIKLKKTHRITKHLLHIMTATGVITFVLPLIFPKYFYPLVWVTFFFILDPINYLHKQPSIIGHLKDRKLAVPLSLLLAGIIMGLLWEFWNYWAVTKWHYNIPFLGFFKIFEMPVLGYLGYFPFAFELYAMYWFIRSLFLHKEHLLSE
jgi:hypothetical protein